MQFIWFHLGSFFTIFVLNIFKLPGNFFLKLHYLLGITEVKSLALLKVLTRVLFVSDAFDICFYFPTRTYNLVSLIHCKWEIYKQLVKFQVLRDYLLYVSFLHDCKVNFSQETVISDLVDNFLCKVFLAGRNGGKRTYW